MYIDENKLATSLVNALARNNYHQLNAHKVVFGKRKFEELVSRGLNLKSAKVSRPSARHKAGPSGVKRKAECPVCFDKSIDNTTKKCKACKQKVCKKCVKKIGRKCALCRGEYN
tara:strand:- start:299 stop:640 length:342 start_codon:yes stop_codon:yes gene_type:complete